MIKKHLNCILSPLINSPAAWRLRGDPVASFSPKIIVLLFALLVSPVSLAAVCKYEIDNEWNTGFQAKVSIINNSNTAINNWEVNWAWSDGSSLVNGWDAVFDCVESRCDAKAPSYALTIGANQTATFGFIGAKGTRDTPVDRAIRINGTICGSANQAPTPVPTGPDSAKAAAILPAIMSLLLAPETSSSPLGVWELDGAESSLEYVSVKNSHNAEVNTFTQGADGVSALSGSIDRAGNAVLAIDLNDLETGVDTRNQRMRDFVFETELLPNAYVSVKLNPRSLSSMSVGESDIQNINGRLSLHGVTQDIQAEVIVAKTSETSLLVSTIKPILIDSKGFDFASGVEVLRNLASLASIGEAVPVYFRLRYELNTDPNTEPVLIASAPAAPSNLSGQYNPTSTNTLLGWQDNSTNESGFIVRRKTAAGLWRTIRNALPNASSYSDMLSGEGTYDYKVIAVNGSVPSAPSNVERVIAADLPDPDPTAEGQRLYNTQCDSCHGASGEGLGSFPALNTPRDVAAMIDYITEFMPLGDSDACDRQCAEQIALFIQTLWNNPPDTTPDGTACRADQPINYGARQLKILTRSEYQRSVEDLLGVDFDAAAGLSEDDKIGLFANNTHTSIVSSSYSNFLIVAEEIAQWSAARDFAPALSCSSFDQSCVNTFINQFAPRVFRRPLDSGESDTYTRLADGTLTGGDVKAGITMALEAMLSAPQFLYRHELGEPNPSNTDLDNDAFELTSYEMATFLAYTFTGSTPDQTLLDAASNNLLRSESEILNQAERLTELAEAKGVLGDFVGSWLGTDDLDIAAKDPSVWPGFDALVPHMKNEVRENFANVMLDRNQSFNALYDADFSYINQTLAQHYGIPGVSGNQMRRVATAERGGILANGAFMARWGEAVETSPIIRSVRVRRRMLCQDELPNPPAGTFAAREERLAALSEILRDPATTNRLKNHLLTEGPPCSNCHLEYINPLGFGMEDFDTVGNRRYADLNGNVIDATGQLFAPRDYSDTNDVEPFTGSKGLAQLMPSLSSAQSCLSKQMFRYISGVGHNNIDASNPEAPDLAEQERDGYACEIEKLTDAMMESSPRTMFERFSTLDAIRYRKAWSRSPSN